MDCSSSRELLKKVIWLVSLLGLFNFIALAERQEVKEPKAALIPDILLQTKTVQVSCGEDADAQTCKFFVNALTVDLRSQQIKVLLFSDPDRTFMGAQSFYVLPRLLPDLHVTLRLIEDGPPDKTRLYVGGFCFDPNASGYEGIQLPRWNQLVGGGNTGPMEADKATAASKLAKEFSAYWIDAIKQKH